LASQKNIQQFVFFAFQQLKKNITQEKVAVSKSFRHRFWDSIKRSVEIILPNFKLACQF